MNGIIIVNKPQGFTSQDVVSKIKKILNEKKAGHTGTLDPLATGVLPVLLGNSTKLSKYLVEHDKIYVAKIRLGEKTETGDSEGKIIEEKNVPELSVSKVENVLNSFLGKQMQLPPMYSAIKVNGKKLYEYARNGQTADIPEREIEVYSISLISFENNEIEFEVKVSKGTYIRTLCEDIAKALGTVGFMAKLQRTIVDRFKIEDSYTFEQIEKGNYKLWTMEEIFKELPKLELNDRKRELFLNGVMLTFEVEEGVYNIYSSGKYIGLGTVRNNLLKRDIVE